MELGVCDVSACYIDAGVVAVALVDLVAGGKKIKRYIWSIQSDKASYGIT